VRNALCFETVAVIVLAVACGVSASSYFIRLTDPHIDANYKQGTGVDCAVRTFGMPCCHDWTNLTPCAAAPRFGHRYCDLPYETADLVLKGVADDFPNPQFVMITGDMASHDMEFETADHIADKWNWIFTEVKKYFGDNIKIIAGIGNHDVYPADQMSDNKTDDFITTVYNVMVKHGVIHEDIPDEKTFSLRGYYKTTIPNSNVDAIVMNNIVDEPYNMYTDPKNRDPAGMYSWLHKVISESASANRKVWLLGHIAPCEEMERTRGVTVIRSLLEEFGNKVITGLFYGHTHKDEFMLTGMKSNENALSVSLLAPGMVARGYINPSARVVEFDGADLNLVDWHQYRMDLANSNKKNQFIFSKVYTFRDHFEVPDLSVKSFQSISERTLTDEAYALKYLNTLATCTLNTTCDAVCRRTVYCQTSFREYEDWFDACNSTDIDVLIKSIKH